MKKLGIYFGLNAVNVVETDGKRVINQFKMPLYERGESIEREKLNVALRDELLRLNIKTADAIITLASKDLLIRSFDLPFMPQNELMAAVSSEAVKYIPFKIEDIIFDYKISPNRKARKNNILFAGIKTDELDNKYLSLLSAAALKPKEIEYAVFSTLKLLRISGINPKSAFAFLDIDIEDESNITVLDENFPQFSRTLKVPVNEPVETTGSGSGVLEKLTSEIRISLDFYRRKFPDREVKDAVVLVKNDLRLEIENLCRDLGIKATFVNLPQPLLDIGTVKAYTASLDIKLPFEIDLLAGREKLKAHKERGLLPIPAAFSGAEGIKIKKGMVVLGIIAAIGVFAGLQYTKIIPLKKEIAGILNQRKSLTTVSANLPYSELGRVRDTYSDKVTTLDRLFKQKQFLTPKFDYLPKLIPDGVWLTDLNFSSQDNTLLIKGAAFLEDSDAEIRSINEFSSRLKDNAEFNKSFSSIITNVKKGTIAEIQVTFFDINCKTK